MPAVIPSSDFHNVLMSACRVTSGVARRVSARNSRTGFMICSTSVPRNEVIAFTIIPLTSKNPRPPLPSSQSLGSPSASHADGISPLDGSCRGRSRRGSDCPGEGRGPGDGAGSGRCGLPASGRLGAGGGGPGAGCGRGGSGAAGAAGTGASAPACSANAPRNNPPKSSTGTTRSTRAVFRFTARARYRRCPAGWSRSPAPAAPGRSRSPRPETTAWRIRPRPDHPLP